VRIAISAVQFGNDRPIGSKRPRAVAQLLAERGHDVTVFTPSTEPHETAPIPAGVTVKTLSPYPSQARLQRQPARLWRRALLFAVVSPTLPRAVVLSRPRLASVFGIGADRRASEFEALNRRRKLTVDRVRSLLDARHWTTHARGQLSASEVGGFDAILSTYAPFGSLLFGRFLARHNPDATWVSDIRDAMVVPSMLWTGKAIMAAEERRAIREASTITVVSEGVKHSILQQGANRRFADRMFVLPNGFRERSTDHEPAARPAVSAPGPLRIGYTGQIYAEGRDATPLFRAIDSIRRDHPGAHVEVHYAGNQGHLMKEFAARYDLEDLVVDHGMLSHTEAVDLQDRVDLLLVLSWNRRDSQGIISGKFGEYLAGRKPILAIVTGDLAGAELSSHVRKMNVGHAYEEISGDDGQTELTEFVRRAVLEREAGRPLSYDPDEDERATFDYETITSRFERLLGQSGEGERPSSGGR